MIKDVRINSEIKNLDIIEHLINEVCACIHVKRSVCENIIIATTEAVSNCIIHGNKKDPSKIVTIHVEFDEKVIHIEVSDEGSGFDIDAIPDPTTPENIESPHGRGIFLMRILPDEFKYYFNDRKFILRFFLKHPRNFHVSEN